MTESETVAQTKALQMLEIFASVGAQTFDLTLTNAQGEKTKFRRALRIGTLQRDLPGLLDHCTRQQENLILRPYGPPVFLIQLDDLDADACRKIAAVSLLQLRTSPGNFQAWIALPAAARDEGFARRVRRGIGADPTASGATRIAGSRNFKEKYAPDFPQIEITASSPGLMASKDQLVTLGLMAPLLPGDPPRRGSAIGAKRWPDYERCLRDAPAKRDHSGPDVSRADFTFCLIALDWGFGTLETAARLMEESSKAKENGERYAALTVENAAAALALRHSKPHNGP